MGNFIIVLFQFYWGVTLLVKLLKKQKNLNYAIEGYLLSCIKHLDTIPHDTGFQSIETVSIPTFY